MTNDERQMTVNALRLYAAHNRRNAPDPARAEGSYRLHMTLAGNAKRLADRLENEVETADA